MQEIVHTTSTQYVLACCFLLIGPALGLIGGFLRRERSGSAALGALWVTGAGWTGWLVSCVVAVVLFPRYPREPIPEPLAMMFVVPGFVTAATALAVLARRGSWAAASARVRRVTLAILAVAILASATLVAAHRFLTMSPALRALPPGAQLLHEQRESHDDFLGDYFYSLTARMTPEQFRAWMQSLELRRGEDDAYGGPDADGSDCGARGRYVDGVGSYESWCS